MGREIVKVPKNFSHPLDENGDFEPGAHLESLHYASELDKTCYQIYENVSEGTPISPIFESYEKMANWLEFQGSKKEIIKQFVKMGHYPSLVIK